VAGELLRITRDEGVLTVLLHSDRVNCKALCARLAYQAELKDMTI